MAETVALGRSSGSASTLPLSNSGNCPSRNFRTTRSIAVWPSK